MVSSDRKNGRTGLYPVFSFSLPILNFRQLSVYNFLPRSKKRCYYMTSLKPMTGGEGFRTITTNERINKSLTDLIKLFLIKGTSHFGNYNEESPMSKPLHGTVGPYCHQNRPERNRGRPSVSRQSEVINGRLTR